MTPDAELYELPEFSAILSFIDAIFSELNMGLLIYHVEEPRDIRTARLIYANKTASAYTGADLKHQVGKTIFDAFPQLVDTDAPRIYFEVVNDKQARNAGIIEYQDRRVHHGRYATRAFPMPNDCIGVLFDKLGDRPAS
ncbi:MAG TPA: hypothetical protein VD788_06845 [Candidatus Polarisedimenticolaceae bacterium]|nr:hypothetical protein [Candidatus Polarisedimenticolaceae bacterium]